VTAFGDGLGVRGGRAMAERMASCRSLSLRLFVWSFSAFGGGAARRNGVRDATGDVLGARDVREPAPGAE